MKNYDINASKETEFYYYVKFVYLISSLCDVTDIALMRIKSSSYSFACLGYE